jgi:hypothetical protein
VFAKEMSESQIANVLVGEAIARRQRDRLHEVLSPVMLRNSSFARIDGF